MRLINKTHNDIQDLPPLITKALDSVTYGVCMVDSNGIVTYVNPAYCKLFKVAGPFMTNRPLNQFVHDELVIKVMRHKQTSCGQINIKHTCRTIHGTVHPVFEDGLFMGVMGTYHAEKEEDNVTKLPEHVVKKHENPFSHLGIISDHSATNEQLQKAYRAAKSHAAIILRGESGTGKELVAQAIHRVSHVANEPFVAINCAAVPDNLIESELFGHEAGSFTGAVKQKKGKFELAQGGTIFLDEIGDLSLDLQAKLLRVIQEKEFERIGGSERIQLRARLITATHQNLEQMIEQRQFREDLYYRIHVIPVWLSPLRERASDIPLLVDHFTKHFADIHVMNRLVVPKSVMDMLCTYEWPGNIRQLKNAIESATVLAMGDELTPQDLPDEVRSSYSAYSVSESYSGIALTADGELHDFETYEKAIIEKALDKYKSFNSAGKRLGLTHKTVASKARKYGLYD